MENKGHPSTIVTSKKKIGNENNGNKWKQSPAMIAAPIDSLANGVAFELSLSLCQIVGNVA